MNGSQPTLLLMLPLTLPVPTSSLAAMSRSIEPVSPPLSFGYTNDTFAPIVMLSSFGSVYETSMCGSLALSAISGLAEVPEHVDVGLARIEVDRALEIEVAEEDLRRQPSVQEVVVEQLADQRGDREGRAQLRLPVNQVERVLPASLAELAVLVVARVDDDGVLEPE